MLGAKSQTMMPGAGEWVRSPCPAQCQTSNNPQRASLLRQPSSVAPRWMKRRNECRRQPGNHSVQQGRPVALPAPGRKITVQNRVPGTQQPGFKSCSSHSLLCYLGQLSYLTEPQWPPSDDNRTYMVGVSED